MTLLKIYENQFTSIPSHPSTHFQENSPQDGIKYDKMTTK